MRLTFLDDEEILWMGFDYKFSIQDGNIAMDYHERKRKFTDMDILGPVKYCSIGKYTLTQRGLILCKNNELYLLDLGIFCECKLIANDCHPDVVEIEFMRFWSIETDTDNIILLSLLKDGSLELRHNNKIITVPNLPTHAIYIGETDGDNFTIDIIDEHGDSWLLHLDQDLQERHICACKRTDIMGQCEKIHRYSGLQKDSIIVQMNDLSVVTMGSVLKSYVADRVYGEFFDVPDLFGCIDLYVMDNETVSLYEDGTVKILVHGKDKQILYLKGTYTQISDGLLSTDRAVWVHDENSYYKHKSCSVDGTSQDNVIDPEVFFKKITNAPPALRLSNKPQRNKRFRHTKRACS